MVLGLAGSLNWMAIFAVLEMPIASDPGVIPETLKEVSLGLRLRLCLPGRLAVVRRNPREEREIWEVRAFLWGLPEPEL